MSRRVRSRTGLARVRVGRVVALAVLAVMVTGSIAGCGVPTQDVAEPIAGLPSPVGSSATAKPDATQVRLWFVRDERLVPVYEPLDTAVSPPRLVDLLAAGLPTSSDGTASSLRTLVTDPVGGGSLVSVAPRAPGDPSGQVTVAVSETFNALPAMEQVLLLGQLVLTLTEQDATTVRVVDAAGNSLAVPLPSGALRESPATRSDYAPLTLRTRSPTPTAAPTANVLPVT